MNYIGSKVKLSPFLLETVTEVVGKDLSGKVFCDIFAGTGAVGRKFKPLVKKVIANDCEYYSFVLNRNYIGNHSKIANAEILIDELNRIPSIDDGLIYRQYCLGGHGERQYFSDYNGQRIDAIRTQIEQWHSNNKIDVSTYFFLLASLLESADKLANTASVYGAYLKHLKKSAQKNLVLEPAEFEINHNDHEVYQMDANVLIKQISGDVLYMDPPYNQRQYGANYHILNTIAEYNNFIPQGKTGLRPYKRSLYCNKKQVKAQFENLVRDAQFRYLFLSYNNEGLMSPEEIRSIMQRYGKYDLVEHPYHRFKADKDENRNHIADHTVEYLHILEKC